MIADLKDRIVNAHPDSYVAPNASVIGSVTLKKGASVWFSAVVRGDCDDITIGEDCNVQDGAVLHADPGVPLTLERGVTVGHNAMLHGCHVDQYALIGINAVVLNNAKIGAFSLIGANALVPEGMEIPAGSLVVGSPAKIKRVLSDEEQAALRASAQHYADNGRFFSEHMVIRCDEDKQG